MRLRTLSVVLVLALSISAQSAHITARQAKDHIGEGQTVCGKVASTRYAQGSKGRPTFLNLDEPYPKQIFTIVIWGNDRSKFGDPESIYANKKVCVTGLIKSYQDVPEVEASEPGQVEIQK